MTISEKKIYPRANDRETVYLKHVITNPNIIVGDFTMYNDFVRDPRDFEKNNVLYHFPINRDRLIMGKFCSIACGAKFVFNSANHTLSSLSTYPFPVSYTHLLLVYPITPTAARQITKMYANRTILDANSINAC